MRVAVIGAGLAGSEVAYQLATRGIGVDLYEMKPVQFSPAHTMKDCAELVCSNSFKSRDLHTAAGLLKREMELFGSLLIPLAYRHQVPAGSTLAIDREAFAAAATAILEAQSNITLLRKPICSLADCGDVNTVVIATGPLSDPRFIESLRPLLQDDNFYFYDSIAPIVDATTIDMGIAYKSSRYDKGDPDYLNIPLSKDEYYAFIDRVEAAEKVQLHAFEKPKYYEACLPIEVMVERGRQTLAYGPLKPVGLRNPHTGLMPYAVIQLRREKVDQELYNMVGFQTKMTYAAQTQILRSLPGMANVSIVRYGSIHRNTYINSPRLLRADLSLRTNPSVYFAGQITGVEGYIESAAIGILCALSILARHRGIDFVPPPATTMTGALLGYISNPANEKNFQPMGCAFGLLPSIPGKKDERKRLYSERGIAAAEEWKRGAMSVLFEQQNA